MIPAATGGLEALVVPFSFDRWSCFFVDLHSAANFLREQLAKQSTPVPVQAMPKPGDNK